MGVYGLSRDIVGGSGGAALGTGRVVRLVLCRGGDGGVEWCCCGGEKQDAPGTPHDSSRLGTSSSRGPRNLYPGDYSTFYSICRENDYPSRERLWYAFSAIKRYVAGSGGLFKPLPVVLRCEL